MFRSKKRRSNTSNISSVSIPSFTVKDGITYYVIKLRSGQREWNATARYSEFFNLREKLQHTLGDLDHYFPPKQRLLSFFGLSHQTKHNRRQMLERWIHEAVKKTQAKRDGARPHLLRFLEAPDAEVGEGTDNVTEAQAMPAGFFADARAADADQHGSASNACAGGGGRRLGFGRSKKKKAQQQQQPPPRPGAVQYDEPFDRGSMGGSLADIFCGANAANTEPALEKRPVAAPLEGTPPPPPRTAGGGGGGGGGSRSPTQRNGRASLPGPDRARARVYTGPTDLVPFVIDNGSHSIKAGPAITAPGAKVAAPPLEMPAMVGCENATTQYVGNEATRRRFRVGDEAEAMSTVLKLSYPFEDGRVVDWHGAEALWRACFELTATDPREAAVVVTAPVHDTLLRDHLCELFFDELHVGALCISAPQPLELFAAGLTTGCVASNGHTVCSAVPVHEGRVVRQAIQPTRALAGQHLTRELKRRLASKRGGSFAEASTASAWKAVQQLKDEHCYVSADACSEPFLMNRPGTTFTLPDGKVVDVAGERYEVPELLFTPEAMTHQDGAGFVGFQDMLMNAVADAAALAEDVSSKQAEARFTQGIVLAGGTTMLDGFEPRFKREFLKVAPYRWHKHTRIIAPESRRWTAFSGGSIVAEFVTQSPEEWVFRDTYDELGPQNAKFRFAN